MTHAYRDESTAVAASTPTLANPTHTGAIAVSDRPAVINLIGFALPILNQALFLAQRGYIISEANYFPHTGQVELFLRLGEADAETVAAAEVAYKGALLIERQHDEAFIKAEALRVANEQARVERQRQLTAQIAAQEAALQALKAAAAAA